MKKRYHTNHSRYQFSLNGTASNRSLRKSVKGVSRSANIKLAPDALQTKKLAKSSQKSINPMKEWDNEEEFALKLADEISQNELQEFAFSCIESLANLANAENQSKEEVLAKVISQKLISFTQLAEERQGAKSEFKEYVVWSKQFISNVQPLLAIHSAPAKEQSELSSQALQCAERSMAMKYRSEVLGKRVDFLVEAVADYVAQIGTQMGFPAAVMNKVAVSVSKALKAEVE